MLEQKARSSQTLVKNFQTHLTDNEERKDMKGKSIKK